MFPGNGLLTTRANVHREFPCRHCWRQTSGTLLPSTTSDWGCLPRFPTNRSSRAVARSSFMVHAWWCFTTFLPAVREFLNSVFPALCVGRGGPTAWPARSSDLNPLDFYLWAHLKSTFWAAEVGDSQDWQQRIQNGFEMIRKTSGTLERDAQSLSDVQRPALKLRLNALNILCNFQGAATRNPCFVKPVFLKHIFSCIVV